MADKLVPLKLPPGLYRNGTKYQASGRWYDANLIRFNSGAIQPIGGWRRVLDDSGVDMALLVGVPRAACAWRIDSGDVFIAIGTTEKLYVFAGGVIHDITPVGFVAGRVDTAFVSATGNYGGGFYGTGLYGSGATAPQLLEADTWQLAPFGNDLAAVCTSERKLYIWAGDPATPAAVAAGSPTAVQAVVVTPERFLIALGATDRVATVFDPREAAWASQESFTQWDPAAVGSSAGSLPVTSPGRLVCGRRTRNQTMLWTDADVHTLTYIGGSFLYRIDQVGDGCGAVGPNAVAVIDTLAMWMGRENFLLYDGFVRPIPCDVRDYVFSDFNQLQAGKVLAVSIAEFGEVWWFYPSASASENDRYACYNYLEQHWTLGQISRVAGFDSGTTEFPVLLAPSGAMYEHEVNDFRHEELIVDILANGTVLSDGSTLAEGNGSNPVEQIPYLESGPFEIGDGDTVAKVQRLVPDDKTVGDVSATLFGALYPDSVETASGPHSLSAQTALRMTARQVRVRLEQVNEVGWRVGTIRLGIRPGGRR
jgi:hypothetical protein